MTIEVTPRTGRALTGKIKGVFVKWGDDEDMRHLSDFINSANWQGWSGMEFDFIWHEGFVHFTSDEARTAFLEAWKARTGNVEPSDPIAAP